MIRRDPRNSPTLAYVVSVLPMALIVFYYSALYSTFQNGALLSFYSYVLVVLLVIWSACAVVYFADVLLPKFLMFLFFGGLAVSAILLLVATYNYLSSYSFVAWNMVMKGIMTLAVLIGLMLILEITTLFLPGVWKNVAVMQQMQEFLAYLRGEYRLTPTYILVLIAVELALIGAYFLVPWLLTLNPPAFSKLTRNGVMWLYQGQLMLTESGERVVATANQLAVTDPEFAGNPYLKNYSLSMWVYMNPRDAQMNEATAATLGPTNLFYYGTRQKSHRGGTEWELVYPKPCVSYMYDYHTKKYTYVIYMDGFEPYYVYLETQKWHELVFVYDDNRMKVFVNGVLNKAYDAPTQMTRFTPEDVIVLGDIQGGLYGAIADVAYYDYPMSPDEVMTSWNLQKHTIDTR